MAGPFELELPGAYIDALVADEATDPRLVLGDRDPEPGETAIPATQVIAFSILDIGAVPGIDLSVTQAYVEDVLAYDGGAGGFQPGFGGAGSSVSATASVVRISINLLSFFSSLQVVNVRVVSATTDAAAALDQSYSFTIADTTPPILLSAVAQDLRRVRLTFSEPIIGVDASAMADALNPGNYEFQRMTAPAVNVLPQSVAAITDAIYDVTTDIELSPGATYLLTCINIEDAAGNAVAAPYNQVEFDAFTPDMPAGRVWDIYKWLPAINRGEDAAGTGDLLKFVSCLQEPSFLLLAQIDRFPDIFDPDYASEPFLSRMLLDLGNPFAFAFDLSEDDKRRLVQLLVQIYKQKGTAPGIINAVRFFTGIEVAITPYNLDGWILGESELGEDTLLGPSTSYLRFSFVVNAPVVLTDDQRDKISKIVRYMKTGWTHFIRLVEPEAPTVVDHWELGLSELGTETILH